MFKFDMPPVERAADFFTLHWIDDNAVDKEKTNHFNWFKTGDCVIKAGETPTQIKCRELKYTDLSIIEDAIITPSITYPINQKYLWLVRFALYEIDGQVLEQDIVYSRPVLAQHVVDRLANYCTNIKINDVDIKPNFITWLGNVLNHRFFRASRDKADS